MSRYCLYKKFKRVCSAFLFRISFWVFALLSCCLGWLQAVQKALQRENRGPRHSHSVELSQGSSQRRKGALKRASGQPVSWKHLSFACHSS